MTTATELAAIVAKAVVNAARLDTFVNGSATTDVTIDGGVVIPSLAKLIATVTASGDGSGGSGTNMTAFLTRAEALGTGNIDKLYLELDGTGTPVAITLNHAAKVVNTDSALRTYVKATLGITDSQFNGLFD